MLSKLEKTRHVVKRILEDDKIARNSDSWLYFKVIQEEADRMQIDLDGMSAKTFLVYQRYFTPFETVRRTRQFVQSKNPELAGTKRVRRMRAELEEEYRELTKLSSTYISSEIFNTL